MSDIAITKANKKVLLIIPAYNERESIEKVVDEIVRDYSEYDYVVVCDGPTDGTDKICRDRDFNAVYLPKNMGLTKCFHNGMLYAYKHDYDYAVQIDGDGQHDPACVKSLLHRAIDDDLDLVLGSRSLEGGTGLSPMRGIGSKLISLTIRIKIGINMTDPTCGLRLYGRKLIEAFSKDSDLAPEPNYIARLIAGGIKWGEVPVCVKERIAGNSYLSPLKAVRYMKNTLISILRIRK